MEAELLKALFAYIESLAVLPVWFPNVAEDTDGNKSPTEPHIRVSVLPTAPEKLSVCNGVSRHLWILQTSIYVRDNVGQIVPAEYADQLRAAFPVNKELTSGGFTFHTEKQGEVIPAVQSADGWYFVPVQFQILITN